MVRISGKPLGFVLEAFADKFIRCEATRGFEPAAIVVGIDKVGQVRFELLAVIIVIAFDSGLLDRSVHAFDLPIGPRVFDLGQAMLDAVFLAAHIEHMGHVSSCRTVLITRREGEQDAIAHWEALKERAVLP